MKEHITWDNLLTSLNNAQLNPEDSAWSIYHYMQANIGDGMTSEEARTLMACYIKLPIQRPSLLHSLMLSCATKMSEVYTDFKFINFLNYWNVKNLRDDDKQTQQGKDNKTYPSLLERVTKAYIRYKLAHPSEQLDDNFRSLINSEAAKLGYKPMQSMYAVKLFERTANNKKFYTAKLIGADGTEIMADSHIFNKKRWEIAGHLYDVMPRLSKTGTLRAECVIDSQRNITDIFPTTVGFVEHYDAEHGHYHVFDNQSRHFVAEEPAIRPNVGDYVTFCPIIPQVDKFKSAAIVNILDKYKARELFGPIAATVIFIDKEKGYIKYVAEDKSEGFCDLNRCPQGLSQGDTIHITTFLKRGKDGDKHPYAGEVY